MGAIAAYLDHVGTGQPIFLQPPVRTLADARMAIDAATRESLELVRTMAGTRDGSLPGTIDRTVTAAGARLCADDLASQLTDKDAILDRLAPRQEASREGKEGVRKRRSRGRPLPQ